MSLKINTIVVTYNREILLEECINSLINQTYHINKIIIVNNNSNEKTTQYLDKIKNDNQFEIINLSKNIGASGGFNIGIKKSYEIGSDWTWIMDDDSIPKEDALEKLVKATSKSDNFGFIASHVVWQNNETHLMNMVCPVPFINEIPYNKYIQDNILLIPSSSFVSCLVKNKIIKEVGLPIKEFFIWFDDIEFTRRIVNAGYIGAYTFESIVLHKTHENYGANIETADKKVSWKFFYGIRNYIYTLRDTSTLRFNYRFIKSLFNNVLLINKRKDYKFEYLIIILKAHLHAYFFRPKIEYLEDEK